MLRIRLFQSFFLLTVLFSLQSCVVRPAEDPILRPVISASFYEEAARKLEEILKADTAKEEYIRLQLSYYDKLDWPPTASQAVERARRSLTLEPVVARMYADFYFQNGRYTALNDLFVELDSTFEEQAWMDRYKVRTYLDMGYPNRAVQILEEMINQVEVDSELAFWAGQAYLSAGDTASAYLYLRDASNEYGLSEQFLRAYLPLTLAQGKTREAIGLAEDYLFQLTASDQMRTWLAGMLYSAGATGFAKRQVWQSVNRQGLLRLSGWYEAEGNWDSAHYCIDRLLLVDSEDLEALLRKGEIDHTRGWLAQAYRHYQQVLDIDSTNVQASEEQALISRKIAYLRRIREAQRPIPVIDLNSKKEIN